MRKRKYQGKYVTKIPPINIPMLVALVLFWLVCVTTYLTAGLYAKYTTSGTGSDSARAMAFGRLTVTDYNPLPNAGDKYVFVPGVPLKKDIRVAFTGSNADCFVFVKAETPGWNASADGRDFIDTPQRLTWSVDNSWTYLCSEENYHVYYRTLDANTPLPETPFILNNDVYVYSPVEENSPIKDKDTRQLYASAPLQLDIKVTGYVVQANGFIAANVTEQAMEAWTAVR